MFLRLILVFLVLDSISAAKQNAESSFSMNDADATGLTLGELLTINLRKRSLGSSGANPKTNKAETKEKGRGLVYSGPVKVITDANDYSKYYMDKGSAFDSTGQDYGEDEQYQQGALYRQNYYSPPVQKQKTPPSSSKTKTTPKPQFRYVPKAVDYGDSDENEDPPEYFEPQQSYDYK